MPSVSFAIPSRGRTRTLQETAASVLRIPSRDVEIVISDNDPTPRPELDNLSQLDSRVKVRGA